MKAGLSQVTGDSGYQCRNYFPSACLLYDWCYPALTPDQRNKLRADIEMCADWVWPETNPPRKNDWAIDNPLNNYFAGFLTTWMAGLALFGDSAKAQGYIDNARAKFATRFMPQLDSGPWKGGVSPEGTSYGVDFVRLILLCLEAENTAVGGGQVWLGDPFVTAVLHLTTPSMDR